ncbi:IS6 family transposase [Yersinia pseudotuberculosis]|uniref:ISYps1 transposase n=1 Tax=Yersinia pseudotuberculosis TaxID=633 RepID=B7UF69_YERPU|nr:IS6 family transposase [Yersinia pseudotuberculosis]CAQ76581.1 ISYps1 transposase [Yersinia pseudotuberculosis]
MWRRSGKCARNPLHRWVIRLVPLLDKAFRQHKRSVGRRWRMDETYIKVKGQWKYLYRAVDTAGQTIDFLLTAKRDAAAALRFFRKAIRHHSEPEVVTIDKSGANTAALTTLNRGFRAHFLRRFHHLREKACLSIYYAYFLCFLHNLIYCDI